MKAVINPILAAAIGVALSCYGARAQETLATSRIVTLFGAPPSATQATSRLVSSYTTPDTTSTQALSRQVVSYITPNLMSTLALSRSVTSYVAPDANSTLAFSREITEWLGFSVQNAATVLRIAGGLHTATPREKQIFDLITAGTSANVVDVLDACRVAVYAMNPWWLP